VSFLAKEILGSNCNDHEKYFLVGCHVMSCHVMYVGRQGSAVLRKFGTVSVYLTERRHIS